MEGLLSAVSGKPNNLDKLPYSTDIDKIETILKSHDTNLVASIHKDNDISDMRKNINKNYKSPNSTIYSEKNRNTFLTDTSGMNHNCKFNDLKQSVVSSSSMPNACNTIDK